MLFKTTSGTIIDLERIKFGFWKDHLIYKNVFTEPEVLGKEYYIKFKDDDYIILNEKEGIELLDSKCFNV